MRYQSLEENIKIAFDTLRSHKVRSLLTVLGVIIGTATVISVASIITGLNNQVVSLLESYGTNTAFIFKWDPGIRIGRLSREERLRKPLKYEDGLAIKKQCPAVEEVSIEIFHRGIFAVKYENAEVAGVNFSGATPSYERVLHATVQEGRFFNEFEDAHREMVCVIGSAIADALFPHVDPVGKEVTIDGRKFKVVGALEKRKGSFFGDDGNDKVVVIPYQTFKKLYPAAEEHFIAIQARPGQLERAIDQATEVLRRRRKVKFDEPNNFGISTAERIIEQFHDIVGAVALVMVVISSVGLLVGGIGVMNIMLVSVTERTREIGIRKAIGARRRDITLQFLSEAMMLTVFGGAIGMSLGAAVAQAIRGLMPNLPTAVPLWSVALGFVVSMAIGLIFGLWPALKAARLDPIEALRYE